MSFTFETSPLFMGNNILNDVFSSDVLSKSAVLPELVYWVTEDGDFMVTEDDDNFIWRRA